MRTIQYDTKCTVWHRVTVEVEDGLTVEEILEGIEQGAVDESCEFLYETVEELEPEDNGGELTKELMELSNGNIIQLWSNETTK